MKSFTRLHVSGFRRLQSVDLEMRPLAVLIGANGSGKTSLLDVLSLLASSASGDLDEKVSDFGGINELLTLDRAKKLFLRVDMAYPPFAPFAYSLTLVPTHLSYKIKEEILVSQYQIETPPPIRWVLVFKDTIRFFNQSQTEIKPEWEINPMETALSQIPKSKDFIEPESFRKSLSTSTYYHFLDVSPRAPIRLPQPLRPATLPGRNGEDLVSCLFYMRETDRDRFEAIEATLRAAFPGFQRLEFPPVAAGTLALAWRDERFNTPLYLHQLSEGMLRFLWLATLLQSPGLTSFTLLDEPEVSLHPELLSLFADLLREASERTQVVVATHSDRLISFLKPEEVVVMDVEEDGMVTATWADQMDLQEWLKEYTLEELWRKRLLGGTA